ncbi:CarD family transcriptional regulator [Bacillaceae bacterium W0354]
MLNIGELVIYSSHGICRVEEITSKTFNGIAKEYYVLRPIENNQNLTINAPVDHNNQIMMLELIEEKEAKELLNIFKSDDIMWVEKAHDRTKLYEKFMNTGNREEIAKVANTLIRKKNEIEEEGKKFPENDNKFLTNIQNILFKELALALNMTDDAIQDKINKLVRA